MKTKRISASALALIATAGVALAADLPSRKAEPAFLPPPPPPPMWTGFYVGLNAGGTWSNSNGVTVGSVPGPCNSIGGGCSIAPNYSATSAFLGTFSTPGSSNGGFIGGGQIGYNYQFYSSLVLGLEADIQGIAGSSGGRGYVSAAANPNYADFPMVGMASGSSSLSYIGTVRGRLGWLFTPTLLVYGTGGLAYGGVNANMTIAQQVLNDPFVGTPYFGGASFSNTQTGWTAGGGIEWMFLPNWSAKVEYLYYDLGSARMNLSPLVNVQSDGAIFSSAFTAATTRYSGNIVRAGLNYHFNWGAAAPVVAKY